MFTIRRAHTDDAKDVAALIKETVAWLAKLGSDQWQGPQFGDADRIVVSLRTGDTWIVESDTQVVATVSLDEAADPEFWTETDDPSSALYLHRMVVARSYAHAHVGSSIIDWASRHAAERGKRWLRLDAWSSNTGLQAYYGRQGFTNVRTLRYAHRGSGALFQKSAGVTLDTGPQLHEITRARVTRAQAP